MQRSEHSYSLPTSASRVQAVLLELDLHLTAVRAREDVDSAEALWIEPGRVFEVRAREYERSRTGGIDRSRTTASCTRYRWDEAALHLSWEWSGHEPLVEISGGVRLEPQGEHTRVHTYREVEVRLPRLGGRLERLIDQEFAASEARRRSLIRERLGL